MDLSSLTSEDLLRMCCVCKKVFLNMNGHSEWIGEEHPMYWDLRDIYGEEITHGYCNACSDEYLVIKSS